MIQPLGASHSLITIWSSLHHSLSLISETLDRLRLRRSKLFFIWNCYGTRSLSQVGCFASKDNVEYYSKPS
ncbi:hypothetical protein L1987_23495 [Smallanthus sonchifolius]|uniref:Uncharacterized protein n=1 Tax=Smallanthus sonchifolius TaxID=185202 RepID=A0ACB9IJ92_9ASTR|nr:hypothetical protein L1987_23495 [Smallanthus sonchifolius]